MNSLKTQSGQMVVEYILVTTIVVGISFAVAEFFRSNELLARMVATPFTQLAGMIQNGQWGSPVDTMSQHPNQWRMRAAQAGDPPDKQCSGGNR